MTPTRIANATAVALLIGVTALVLAAVSCTLYYSSLPGSSTRHITKPRHGAERLVGPHDTPVIRTRQLFCMYDVYGSKSAEYDISDVPTPYCNNIIVCCITEEDLDRDKNIVNSVRYFVQKAPSVKIYIGLFAEGGKGSWLFDALSHPKGSEAIIDSFNTFTIKHGINGGVYMWIPNFKDFRNVPIAIEFITGLSVRMRLYGWELVFTLPTDEHDLTAYFPMTVVRNFHGRFVKISHFTPSFNVTDQRVPCSTPWKAWGSTETLGQVFRSLSAWHFFESVNVSKKVMLSMDVVAYTYVQKRNFPFILTDRMVAPFVEFCAVCSSIFNSIKFWKVYEDKETKCRIAATEDGVGASANPRLIRDILAFYDYTLPGIVVHNIHLDDFAGTCGPPHGFIKSVFCELERISEGMCNMISPYADNVGLGTTLRLVST